MSGTWTTADIEAWCHREMRALADTEIYKRAEAILRLSRAARAFQNDLECAARLAGMRDDEYPLQAISRALGSFAIVRDLAAADPMHCEWPYSCVFCDAGDEAEHDITCPWRRAKEALGQ